MKKERKGEENVSENIISAIGVYDGSSTKNSFDVELKMSFTESRLSEAIQFVASVGKRLRMVAQIDGQGEKIILGTWSLNRLSVDRNAQTKISFKSTLDSVYPDNLNKLIVEDCEIYLKAKIV